MGGRGEEWNYIDPLISNGSPVVGIRYQVQGFTFFLNKRTLCFAPGIQIIGLFVQVTECEDECVHECNAEVKTEKARLAEMSSIGIHI